MKNAARIRPNGGRVTRRHYAACLGLLLLLVGTVRADAAGHYCLSKWPSDYDVYSLCVDLQNRNQYEFQTFLKEHGLRSDTLAAKAAGGNVSARIAQTCRSKWYPNYEMITRCTKREAAAAKKHGEMH